MGYNGATVHHKSTPPRYTIWYSRYLKERAKPLDRVYIVQSVGTRKYLFVSKNKADCMKWIHNQKPSIQCRILKGDLNSDRNYRL